MKSGIIIIIIWKPIITIMKTLLIKWIVVPIKYDNDVDGDDEDDDDDDADDDDKKKKKKKKKRKKEKKKL